MKRAIISADDFGMSVEVNEAIEQAHINGVLSTASLMVSGPAAQDAVERAKRLPSLMLACIWWLLKDHRFCPTAACR